MESAADFAGEFWNRDEARRDQMLYTAFCLVEAGLLNYALGRFLARRNVYDWASTSLYYSLLYSARLIIFLGVGDFPLGHSHIGALFTESEIKDKAWFRDLAKKVDPELGSLNPRQTFQKDVLSSRLLSRGATQQNIDNAFDFFARNLKEATKLRNDSSYESLLVAHAYNHRRVTEAFEDLSAGLQMLSLRANTIAIGVLTQVAKANTRLAYFTAFLNDRKNREGLYYFEDHLKHRFSNEQDISDHGEIINECIALVEPLRMDGRSDPEKADSFRRNVSLESFDSKSRLMNDFRNRSRRLRMVGEEA
jgi:hypothetical protein